MIKSWSKFNTVFILLREGKSVNWYKKYDKNESHILLELINFLSIKLNLQIK
jgi:hypothetical protein